MPPPFLSGTKASIGRKRVYPTSNLFCLLTFAAFLLSAVHASELPTCVYGDQPTLLADYDNWSYTLLDTQFKLPEAYKPDDLVPVSIAGVGNDGMYLRAQVIPALRSLLTAASAAGMVFEIQSAYRSYTYQAQTFDYWVAQDGRDVALKSSARAGHSEHQLGTALDFRSADGPPAWELEDWGKTSEGRWLADNASRFGFIMSYPSKKEAQTCYVYEPWHYRYVGRDVAAEVQASGLTLREWLWDKR